MRTGEFFGERSLLYQKPRAASIMAMRECHLAILHAEDFKAIEEKAQLKRHND